MAKIKQVDEVTWYKAYELFQEEKERYNEFADLRPKGGKVPLWKIIEDL